MLLVRRWLTPELSLSSELTGDHHLHWQPLLIAHKSQHHATRNSTPHRMLQTQRRFLRSPRAHPRHVDATTRHRLHSHGNSRTIRCHTGGYWIDGGCVCRGLLRGEGRVERGWRDFKSVDGVGFGRAIHYWCVFQLLVFLLVFLLFYNSR